MTRVPGTVATVTSETARQNERRRRGWALAMVICAGGLLWCGAAMYRRLTYPWSLAHVVQGFVGYGAHETEYSPDGTQIAVGFREQAKVLDLASGQELSRLQRYGGSGISAFSSDGGIVSRFPDGTEGRGDACLWNASDGRILARLRLPESVHAKRSYPFFSPDNKWIVAACEDGLVLWDSSDLTHAGHIKIAALEPVGRIEITRNKDPWLDIFLSWNPVTHEMTGMDADGKLLRIDLPTQTATRLLGKQERAVKAANWSPDGTRLVTIDREDGSIAVWDVASGAVVAALSEKDAVSARFSPDGGSVVTKRKRGDVVRTGRRAPPVWDRWTRIWDAKSGQLIQELPTTTIVTLSPDWSFWVDAGPEGVRIARFDGSESCSFPRWFDGHGSVCAFSHNNRYLAYVNGSGLVAVWQRRDPIRSWTEWLTLYELWMLVLAATGLAWSVSRFRAISSSAAV